VQQLCEAIAVGEKATHPQIVLAISDEPELHLRCARTVADDRHPPRTLPSARPLAPITHDLQRIRLAYISGDFREHPVSYLAAGVWERHDRGRFEVIGVSLRAAEQSELGQRVRGAFDRFIEVGGRSDEEVARLLRELQVDIAVDLMGYTQGMRLGIFAHRVAAVQVNYLGYAGTLGAPYMDYLIADEVVIPAGAERHYAEQVVRLPHCYLPTDDRREIAANITRAQAGLPEGAVVFCAFSNTYKINPPLFDVWMRLLREVPGSVLWLRAMEPVARANLLREAQQRGIEAQRVVFAESLASMAEHLGRQGLADLFLDTYPYNAHSTACDALWSGVPVLTCAGRSMASRVAASALRAVGLAELVTHSLAEYEAKALQLASQPARLQALKTRLWDTRAGSPLFDTTAYTRSLEQAFLNMLDRQQRGHEGYGAIETIRSVSARIVV